MSSGRHFAIASSVVLYQVYTDDGHVVATNAFFVSHLLKRWRTDLVQQLVVDRRHLSTGLARGRQHLAEVLNHLITRFAIPDAVAGQDYELDVFMQRPHCDIWEGSDHVVVEVPAHLRVFRRGQRLVLEIADSSAQSQHPVNSPFFHFSASL